jgi:hypothetical protein
MSILTEDRTARAGHYLISESNGYRSREQATIVSGSGVLKAGTVLGKVATGTATAAAKQGGNTGDATISTVALKSGAKAGIYTVTFTAATKFDVHDPEGFKIKSGATGAAYSDDISFTITAGSEPMVAGDGFTITVAPGVAKYAPYDPAGDDGSEVAAAILFEGCDATESDVRRTVSVRDCEVHAAALVWGEGVTSSQKSTALASLAKAGIAAR